MIIKLWWLLRTLIYKPFLGKLGTLSYVAKPLYLSNLKRIFIGSKVRIFPLARMEVIGNNASITFEDDVSIGQYFHIISKGELLIGKGTTISANVLITNVDHEYQEIGKHILEQPLIVKETKIGENCFIGYGAVIQAGTILGKQCIVGANAVVRGSFKDYSVIVGVPAKVVKRYDIKKAVWRKTDDKGNFINE